MKNQRLLPLWALAVGLAVPACAVTPDPCASWPQACLAVTVEHGPADVYQLLVAVLDGYGSTTPVTPRSQPNQPLLYPLRFAIRFGEFDPFHKGTVTFTVEALNHTNDVIGYLRQSVALQGEDHQRIAVSLGGPADLGSTDLAESDFSSVDGASADLRTTPDMP
jgi:hypothetical protein